MICRPLLVASLGNPSTTYRNTLHSAGHTLLFSLQHHLAYPPFAKSRLYGNGLVSQGENCTLWQSPTFMNVSGPAVAAAWKTFLNSLPSERRLDAKLIVVHDELESPLGKIKFKQGGSAKGHNGLKSVTTSLGGAAYMKMGVGIGRPESRESKAVAEYVLKKMNPTDIAKITDGVDTAIQGLIRIRDEPS